VLYVDKSQHWQKLLVNKRKAPAGLPALCLFWNVYQLVQGIGI